MSNLLSRATLPRGARLIVWTALGWTLCAGASCGGRETNEGDEVDPPADRIESLDAVDNSDLTGAERRVWIDLVNEQLSPCGEPVSVARCARDNSACRSCVPAARYLVRLIGEGYERQEIEEHYRGRYGRGQEVELSLDGSPVRGSSVAEVTIVEFSDFECPYCGRAHPILQQVLEEFRGRVRLVFKHYPLSGHPHAMPAARAAVAAGNQGKFWEMHDLLFEHQRQLEDADILRYAAELGLDMERFAQDVGSPETQRLVERDQAAGREVGVDGTPSFFVGDRRFRRFREPATNLAAYLREELD